MPGRVLSPMQRRSKNPRRSIHVKLFPSTFTGSLCGAGPDVFVVWLYAIANARGGAVELNPAALASVLGCTQERIETAINYLCQPDPLSRNQSEEGRHLVREGQWQYRLNDDAI
jgi:hypothetical protein